MSTVQQQSFSELARISLTGSRDFLGKILDSLNDDQLTARAGGTGNHSLWVMGHIVFADDLFVSAFQEQASMIPESYQALFGQGSHVSANASDYPSRAELLEKMDEARARTLEWVSGFDDESAFQAAPEQVQAFANNAIEAATTLAQHEFMHAGQLTSVRASLGMKPLFG